MPEPVYSELLLGIDGGGTKCCAVITDKNGNTLGKGLSGPANAYQNLQQTQLSIIDAATLALHDAGLPETALSELIAGVGLAGVNVPSVFAAMSQWQHPFKKMHLTTDLHIACLGAHSGKDGAVIIVGTGSCGYSFVNNKATILGGHGFLLGDNGSGAWIGLQAVKAILLAMDRVGAETIMEAMLCDYLQITHNMIVDKLTFATPSDFAKIARLVLTAAQQQDEVATAIVSDAANYIDAVAHKLLQAGSQRLAIIGGLSNHIVPWLNSVTTAHLSLPDAQPEFGATLFAKQQC